MTEEEDANPFAYLVDFGIARSSTQEGTALTATTGTVGTVAYMSPERIAGEHGDLPHGHLCPGLRALRDAHRPQAVRR